MPSLIKNWEMKYTSFVIFMKELKNKVLKNIKINYMIIFTSMVYTLFKSKFVSMSTKISRCTMVTRKPKIRCLKNHWCVLIFALLSSTFTFVLFFPTGIYLLKVNNRNTRTRCEICSKLTIKIPEWSHWDIKHISRSSHYFG